MAVMTAGASAREQELPLSRYRAADDATLRDGFLEIRGNIVYLYHAPSANLRKLEARLRSRYLPLAPQYRDLFTNPAYPIESRISARLQYLLLRTEDILGMKPAITKLNLKLYGSRKDLQVKCFEIMRTHANYKSFYVHAFRTVFSSEDDVSDTIIAHEFSHAVQDYYFTVPPPSKVAEHLANFVEQHLESD